MNQQAPIKSEYNLLRLECEYLIASDHFPYLLCSAINLLIYKQNEL